ncbi:S6 family peptidase [Yersinia ruckeri]|uniref:S6 family peptidase n=1 Tax=Yersinia ruckeri TaxID=29486 RepID=UPI0022352F87|nr:S6 family peptidase [Yersinia ruckeri]
MKKKLFLRLNPLLFLMFLASTKASTLRSDIPYQTYRDFAENKGIFSPGEINIKVYNKENILVGILDKAPMIDFSSTSSLGIATLINPQFIAGVAHNGGFQSVSFGGSGKSPDYDRYNYKIVERNNAALSFDFHAPRLNKIVTEVIPSLITTAGIGNDVYTDKTRFPIFYRVGSGAQYIQNITGEKTRLTGAYDYLTGGTVGSPLFSDWSFVSKTLDLFSPENSPLGGYTEPGDSGSPLFGWDTRENKWVLIGVLQGLVGSGNRWVIIPTAFVSEAIRKITDPTIFNDNKKGPLLWGFSADTGRGQLSQLDSSYTTQGLNGSDFNAGRNIIFSGDDGIIIINNNINQGAGTLTFKSNYLVQPKSDQFWVGGGIDIDLDKTVTWSVNGVENDSLHKIGQGTLIINAKGINSGELSVGDGVVILNQLPDANKNIQAFSKIDIVSGRPTVVLSNDKQIDPNSIFFGYKGGALDANGNNITFQKIHSVDNGAQIINHNNNAASVIITGYEQITNENIKINQWSENRIGTPGEIYVYNNKINNKLEYFRLTEKNYGFFPTDGSSYNGWVYLGIDKNTIINDINNNNSKIIYPGFFGEKNNQKDLMGF